MNIKKDIEKALKIQGQNTKIKECPITIVLKSGPILNFCYIEQESNKTLTIVETTKKGTEELRLINKDDISYISIIYANTEFNTKNNTNNMYI